jgi:hypothetical protein
LIANYPNRTSSSTGWYVTVYSNGTYGTGDGYGYASNLPYPPLPTTRRERKLAALLREFDGAVKQVEHRLQVEAAFQKVLSDTRSRERRPHPSVRRGKERRMQTYTAALAARMASRRP